MAKMIKLHYGYYGQPITDASVINDSLEFTAQKIHRDQWDNRPQYDEDSGAMVSNEKYSPFLYCGKFAILCMVENMMQRIKLTPEEMKKFDAPVDAPDSELKQLEFEREFERREMAFIIQTMFLFMENIEQIYEEKARSLYESDNHYTGKPVSYFVDQSKIDATRDRREILKMARHLNEVFN